MNRNGLFNSKRSRRRKWTGFRSWMARPVRTIDDVLAALGTPSSDSDITIRSPEREDAPPSVERRRELRSEDLSEMAWIWITERPDGKVPWQLQAKPIVK